MFDAKALLAGDENALSDAVEVLSPELYRYAAGILLSRMDAEDAVQCAFSALWQHRSSIQNPDGVRAYLYRCTYRAAVDIIRRNRLLIPLERRGEDCPLSEEMKAALSRLSAAERAIVYERAVFETSYDELAERLGLRKDNVRKKYERAKKKLALFLPLMRK
ncbi:MAG: sigma-70 family RNA polymerase sigma factor [Clostridia bacterium]|nr:sigma-70 family RNA polymerase sigma factor [Clostridia bacterium]